ncbi:WbqC family protein [Thiohalorhabdus methylotrophus]|uniref:WbqC family protein n=1 Tax=Thiohalorhabdus methylotrophus TaxID=3242694 RepID=A0ABV4U2N7_9GAMM
MIVSINQPAYLPWLGYFDRIAKSDLHIVLDHVQFEKNSMVPRNKIRTPQGWTWLTVPVLTKGRSSEATIQDIGVNNQASWGKKHWKALQANYARAPHFAPHKSFFEDVFQETWEQLFPLLERTNGYLMDAFNISTPLVRSSELRPKERKSELVLELCKKVEATTYISGPFGREYLNLPAFEAAEIEVVFHDYPHPEYNQVFDGFEPYMSAIDLLFNYGPDSRGVLDSSCESLTPCCGV